MDKAVSQQKTFLDKVIKDKDGHIAIWQMPNIPLYTWIIASILSKIIAHGWSHDMLTTVAYGALFTWALMEIFTGVNYFRRVLGMIVLITLILSKSK